MTGLGPNMNQAELLRLARNPSGVADLLGDKHPETGDSPAEIMADIINVQRADTKRLAALHEVDIEINRMTPDRAAELLAGCIQGDGIELVLVFNELAEMRDRILRESLDGDEYSAFVEQKHAMMHTEPEE